MSDTFDSDSLLSYEYCKIFEYTEKDCKCILSVKCDDDIIKRVDADELCMIVLDINEAEIRKALKFCGKNVLRVYYFFDLNKRVKF